MKLTAVSALALALYATAAPIRIISLSTLPSEWSESAPVPMIRQGRPCAGHRHDGGPMEGIGALLSRLGYGSPSTHIRVPNFHGEGAGFVPEDKEWKKKILGEGGLEKLFHHDHENEGVPTTLQGGVVRILPFHENGWDEDDMHRRPYHQLGEHEHRHMGHRMWHLRHGHDLVSRISRALHHLTFAETMIVSIVLGIGFGAILRTIILFFVLFHRLMAERRQGCQRRQKRMLNKRLRREAKKAAAEKQARAEAIAVIAVPEEGVLVQLEEELPKYEDNLEVKLEEKA